MSRHPARVSEVERRFALKVPRNRNTLSVRLICDEWETTISPCYAHVLNMTSEMDTEQFFAHPFCEAREFAVSEPGGLASLGAELERGIGAAYEPYATAG